MTFETIQPKSLVRLERRKSSSGGKRKLLDLSGQQLCHMMQQHSSKWESYNNNNRRVCFKSPREKEEKKNPARCNGESFHVCVCVICRWAGPTFSFFNGWLRRKESLQPQKEKEEDSIDAYCVVQIHQCRCRGLFEIETNGRNQVDYKKKRTATFSCARSLAMTITFFWKYIGNR